MKRPTLTAIKKAITAVEADVSRYEIGHKELSIFEPDWDQREREGIVIRQAVAWLAANGYDTSRVTASTRGNYVVIDWDYTPSYTRELIALNID